MSNDIFLPGLPVALIRAAFEAAPGNEIGSGKLTSPESSAALAANAFGYFLDKPDRLPPFPGVTDRSWPAQRVCLEATVRFPWAGGEHPCLDALVATQTHLIGVESKRYEPFRAKRPASLSDAYWRPVWGEAMTGYQSVRDALKADPFAFRSLDAAQLVKHAFGLRTASHRDQRFKEKRPTLWYLHAEPRAWADRRAIGEVAIEEHRRDIEGFAAMVAGDEVAFHWCSYRTLLRVWSEAGDAGVRSHAQAMIARFDV